MKPIKWDLKPISKVGMYSDIPIEGYHSATICDSPAVSSSDLRTLCGKSPKHMFAKWSCNPDRIENEDKPHFTLGRATHHLLLGEAKFSELFVAQPAEYPAAKTGEMKKWTRSAQHCKDWEDEHKSKGRQIITPDDIKNIRGMMESLRTDSLVKVGALNGLIEQSIIFKDKATGLWIKSRPDAIPASSADFVDLKTTRSVIWGDLRKTINDYGYIQQGALVRQAAREVLNIKNATFTLIFVESKEPWCTRSVEIKQHDLDLGERLNRHALDTVARCVDTGHWPGPGGEREDAEQIELTDRDRERIEEQLKYGVST